MASAIIKSFLSRRILVLIFLGFAVLTLLSVAFYTPYIPKPSSEWIPNVQFGPANKPSPVFSYPPKDKDAIVHLDYASIQPEISDTVKSYWNIPYAAPAFGENRFRGPQPPPKYNRNGEILKWNGKLGMCPVIQKIDATKRNREDLAGPEVRGFEQEHSEDC